MNNNKEIPRFIYLTGCDGTGKTTQVQLLLNKLARRGVHARHLWLRFPFLFSLPLLIYARIGGYSWYEKTGSVKHGYWDFRRSWILMNVFPWVLLIDATLFSLLLVHLPLRFGNIIVCERFVLDMLVDLSIARGSYDLFHKLPGKLFFKLLPQKSKVLILNLDSITIRERRSDLKVDYCLERKLEAFEKLISMSDYKTLSSNEPICTVNAQICSQIGLNNV